MDICYYYIPYPYPPKQITATLLSSSIHCQQRLFRECDPLKVWVLFSVLGNESRGSGYSYYIHM